MLYLNKFTGFYFKPLTCLMLGMNMNKRYKYRVFYLCSDNKFK